jgi:hypothetical protein
VERNEQKGFLGETERSKMKDAEVWKPGMRRGEGPEARKDEER